MGRSRASSARAVFARTRVGRRAAPAHPSERVTRAALGGRAVSAEAPGTASSCSLSFIEGIVLSLGTGEALRDRPTPKLRGRAASLRIPCKRRVSRLVRLVAVKDTHQDLGEMVEVSGNLKPALFRELVVYMADLQRHHSVVITTH